MDGTAREEFINGIESVRKSLQVELAMRESEEKKVKSKLRYFVRNSPLPRVCKYHFIILFDLRE